MKKRTIVISAMLCIAAILDIIYKGLFYKMLKKFCK